MAGYGCAYDDDCPNQINWILTSISPSFTISLCDDHMAPGVIPLLGANIGVEAGKLYESIKRFTDREAAREAREAQQQQPGEQAADQPEPPIPGEMGTGNVNDDDEETLQFADESEYAAEGDQ